MSARRIAGLLIVIVGVVALAWGGIFWTDRDTVVDAGPLEITTANREGIALPPIVGGLAVAAGILLIVIPERRRA